MNEYKTLKDIVNQLEMSEYECTGGYLKNNIAFIKLKELAEQVNVPLDLLVIKESDPQRTVLLAEMEKHIKDWQTFICWKSDIIQPKKEDCDWFIEVMKENQRLSELIDSKQSL